MADDVRVTVAGLVLQALDTGRVFLAQRALDETDDLEVRETWEFPGGHLNEGESPVAGAVREFAEEVGFAPPSALAGGGWISDDGRYEAFHMQIAYEFNVADWTPTEEVQAVGWFDWADIAKMMAGDLLRPEVAEQTPWASLFDVKIVASGWGAPSGDLVIVEREEKEMASISEKPWDGSASRFTNEQWYRSTIVHLSDDSEVKSDHKLPIREPNGDLSRAGVHAAASRLNQVDAPAEEIAQAKTRLRSAYRELDEDAPESLVAAAQAVDELVDDDDFDPDDFSDFDLSVEDDGHIPFHGVAIAFDQDTGDRRAFPSEGLVRVREVPIPLMYAKSKGQGHNGAEIVGLITRVTRDDTANLMRFSGYFADTDLTDGLIGLIAEFGRLNLSVDLDDVREVRHDEASGVTIFADSRIAGMTALAIGAFAETYIALGPSDNSEEDATPEEAVDLAASANIEFARGPGWATHPRETSRLYRYWTKGPGAAKIRWNTPGDFYRCRRLVGAKIAKNSPEKLRFINQICARWHKDVTGVWTGDRRNPGNRRGLKASVDVGDMIENLTASVRAPIPAEWFTEPTESKMTFTYDEATGLTRVTGMIAEWRRCHLGYDGRCVLPPRGGSYRLFRKGTITTTEGELPVGTLTFGTGHPSLRTSIAEAQARYDNLGRAWAFVNVGENRQGIWFSGVVNPDLSEETVFAIKAGGAVSGDWKAYEGRSEMIAAVSVNVPGYPQPLVAAAFDENDDILAMTAAGIVMPEDLREERLDQLRELALTVSRSDRIDTLKALIEGEF